MKKLLTLCVLFLFAAALNAQILLDENFEYAVGDSLTGHGWVAHSGTASTSTILVQSGNLSYPNYPLSDIGNYVTISGTTGSRQDVNKSFTEQTSGSVYAFVMVNVTAAAATGDYFMHFGANTIGTNFRGKLFVVDNGSGSYKFGLSKGSNYSASTLTTTGSYAYNTTHLLVLEYKIVSGTTTDDSVKLYVDPDLSVAKPVANIVSGDATTDINVGSIALRQSTQLYSVLVDGIRVTTQWLDVVPVELTSFNAISNGNDVNCKLGNSNRNK